MDRRIFNIIMLPIAIACALEILSVADNIYETTCRSALVQTYSPSNDCFIYVNGHIEKPGVYKLSADCRVIDAISAAGGFRLGADIESVNITEQVRDCMQVIVQKKK